LASRRALRTEFLEPLARASILPLWWAAVVLIALDRAHLTALLAVLGVCIATGVLTAWWGLPEERRRFALRCLMALAALSLLASLNILRRDRDDMSFRYLFVAAALMAAGVVLHIALRAALSEERHKEFDRLRLATTLLFLILFLAYASCFAGRYPQKTFARFSCEFGVYFPLAQVLMLLSLRRRSIRPVLAPLALTGLVFTAGAILVYLGARFGSGATRVLMEYLQWIRWDGAGDAGACPWRVQFPFIHHNRLGSYSLLAAFAWLAWRHGPGNRAHSFAKLLAAIPLAALSLSGTRGAYIAAACGLAAFFLSGPAARKPRTWCVMLAILLLPLCFSTPRGKILSLFEPATYTHPGSTVHMRLPAWSAGWNMALDRPFLGNGYGTNSFQKLYEKKYLKRYIKRFDDSELKPHAHNNYLEIASEIGFPGLAFFLGLNAFIALGLWRRRLETAECSRPALLGLLVAINIYGLANYSLRFSIGALIWVLLALMAVDCSRESRVAPLPARPSG
jgi:O-antigen ligase